MNERPAAQGYSALQIALHWIVVALVAFQLVFGEGMSHLYRALARGRTPEADTVLWGNFHIWVGFAVLAAVALRLMLRVRRSPQSEETSPLLAWLAWATHVAFYVVLVALPISGAVAYYFNIHAAGDLHEFGKPLLIALITLHVLAALWHQFVRRDGLLMRMLVPR